MKAEDITMSLRRRTFSKEFKLHVLKEVQEGGGVLETAKKYSIHPNLIGKWRNHLETYKDEAFAGPGHAYTAAARISALERENAKLSCENELLKKALSHYNQQASSCQSSM